MGKSADVAGSFAVADPRTGVAYCRMLRFVGAPEEKVRVRFAMGPVALDDVMTVFKKEAAMVIAVALLV